MKALSIPTADTEVRLIEMIGEVGHAALANENSMVLYTVASDRVTSRPVGQIYGNPHQPRSTAILVLRQGQNLLLQQKIRLEVSSKCRNLYRVLYY